MGTVIVKQNKMNPTVSSIDIGDACFCQGDYYRALERYFPVLRTLERGAGFSPLVTATLYFSIGASYDWLKRNTDALHYYHKAIVISERCMERSIIAQGLFVGRSLLRKFFICAKLLL